MDDLEVEVFRDILIFRYYILDRIFRFFNFSVVEFVLNFKRLLGIFFFKLELIVLVIKE